MAKRDYKSAAELAAEAATQVVDEKVVATLPKIHHVSGKPGAQRSYLRVLPMRDGEEEVKVSFNTPETMFTANIRVGDIVCVDEGLAFTLIAAQQADRDPNAPKRWERVTVEE